MILCLAQKLDKIMEDLKLIAIKRIARGYQDAIENRIDKNRIDKRDDLKNYPNAKDIIKEKTKNN